VQWVYILRCADACLYVGETCDLAARLSKHRDGSASRFTAKRRPVTLVYSEECVDGFEGKQRERQIKRWTRAKKEALIAGDLELLRRL
jgi:predicted GIY-YIG superfamily endonuclease